MDAAGRPGRSSSSRPNSTASRRSGGVPVLYRGGELAGCRAKVVAVLTDRRPGTSPIWPVTIHPGVAGLPAAFARRRSCGRRGIALRLRVEGGGAASGAEVHGAGAGGAVRGGGRGVHLHAAHRVGDRRPAGWAVAARAVVNVPAAG